MTPLPNPAVRRAGLVFAVALAAAALAGMPGPAAAVAGDTIAAAPAPAGPGTRLAVVFQQSVPLNPVGVFDRWRCQTRRGLTVYYTTGNTEAGTAAALRQHVDGPIYCRRKTIMFPF